MRRSLTVLLSSVALASVPALAQEAEDIELDAIVVSGEKLPRSYQDTFSSVGIATNEDIETYQIDSLRESFNMMGNVRWFDKDGGNNGLVIRGINSEGVTQPNNDAPVTSVIIDGATQSVEGVRRGSRGMWDVKQVEVFRGPQSTLQGRAALAGAVIVETNDPTYHVEAGIKGKLSQEENKEAAIFVSAPIIEDQVAFRLSGQLIDGEKDIDYAFARDSVLGEDKYHNVRGKLLIEPEALPGFSALFTASNTYDKPANTAVNKEFFDRRFSSGSFVEVRETQNNNYVAELNYEINDKYRVQSISSIIDTKLDISTPPGDPVDRVDYRLNNDFTQDVRLLIGDEGDKLSGVVGAFYGKFRKKTDSYIKSPALPFPAQDLMTWNDTENISAYTDLRYRAFNRVSLLGGLRVMHDKVANKAVGTAFDTGSFTLVTNNVSSSVEETVLLPKLGVSYELDDQQTLAFTAQKGFRSGFTEMVTNPAAPAVAVANKVESESLWSYELAYRAEDFNNRWMFGATAFYYDYTNQQIPTRIDPSNAIFLKTVNAGSSFSYGAEFEGRYNFDNGLSVFGSLGLLKTEFEDLVTNSGNHSGNKFPEAPSVTAGFGANYKHESGLFAGADVNYTSSYYSTGSVANDAHLKIDGYWLANARVGYEKKGLKATLFVDNLFDEKYITALSGSGNNAIASVGDDRKFGLELSARF